MDLRKRYLLTLLTGLGGLFTPEVWAQNDSSADFLGINPGVTIEPFYEKGEFDVSLFPLVYQSPLTKRLDLRLTTILNLGVRNSGNAISHLGLEAALPIFFREKESVHPPSEGFFVAPILSLTRNRIKAHYNLGVWVEPGYNMLFNNNFALFLGLQLGGTYFKYDNERDELGGHFGLKAIFGRWFCD